MAYFTVWRIHECNANFLKTFLGDKARLIFWLAAFFLIFTTSLLPQDVSSQENMRKALAITMSSIGAFLLTIEIAYLANRLFGRSIELLTCWLLLTFPGFLIYAHYGRFIPFAAALSFAAILLMLNPNRIGFMRSLIFGLLCSGSALLSSAAGGIMIPVVCTWLLRGVRRKTLDGTPMEESDPVRVIAGFLIGLFPIFVPMLIPKSSDWHWNLYQWYLLIFTGDRPRESMLELTIILAAAVPWLFLSIPAMDVLNLKLEHDRNRRGVLTLPVFALSFGLIAGAVSFNLGILLPFAALLAAWALDHGFQSAPNRKILWENVILKIYSVLLAPVLPIACFAAPFWYRYCYYKPGMTFTQQQVEFFYIRLPAAGLCVLIWTFLEMIRRKKGKSPLIPSAPFLDRWIPSLWILMMILIP